MAKLNVEVIDMVGGEVTKIKHEGETYLKTTSNVSEGDIVCNTDEIPDQEVHEYYEVEDVSLRVYVIDDAGDLFGHPVKAQGDAFEVFRKVKDNYKAGDKARLTIEGGKGFLQEFDDGDIVVVSSGSKLSSGRYEVTKGLNIGFAFPEQLEPVEDYEKEDAAFFEGDKVISLYTGKHYTLDCRAPETDGRHGKGWHVEEEPGLYWIGEKQFRHAEVEKETINKGDKVELLSGGNNYPLFGFDDGDICRVEGFRNDHDAYEPRSCAKIVKDSGVTGYALPSQLKKVAEVGFTRLEGVYVKFHRDHLGITGGHLYKVTHEGRNTVDFFDDDADKRTKDRSDGGFVIKKFPVSPEEDGRKMSPSGVNPGDKVRITDPLTLLDGYKSGDVLVVKSVDSDGDITVKGICETIVADEYTKIIPHVAIEVGAKVLLAIPKGGRPKYAWGGVRNGEEGEVVSVHDDGDVYVNFPGQSRWRTLPNELDLIEAPESGSKEDEDEEGDYQAGDVVAYKDNPWFENAGFGVVTKVNIAGVQVKAIETGFGERRLFLDKDKVKLVCRKENREDI